MSIWSEILKFVVKKFWPWFKQFVWPIIKEHIMEFVSFVIQKLIEIAKDMFSEKTSSRQQEAQSKAEEAESKASDATNDAEAEKYQAVAKVWREVAEQFRRDNEELKRKLEEAGNMAENVSAQMVDEMDLDVDFSKEKPVMKLSKRTTELPALPR